LEEKELMMSKSKAKKLVFDVVSLCILAGVASGHFSGSEFGFMLVGGAIFSTFATVFAGCVAKLFGKAKADFIGLAVGINLAFFALGVVAGSMPSLAGIAIAVVTVAVVGFAANECINKYYSARPTSG